ncbi:recombinase family protein [Speluncibacter jeojiensis]|uniref:Recombinase family protein n=1 Tax=Speluncibacter jeojiensis TaxID=2710754 RepID=A0A9X4M1B7_9ACTN|nr:recombinase family protein [Rhodococcus sp. D2-41]MDG3014517.1 recombinase family protein [Corynebacteriales bacterium D3-21]
MIDLRATADELEAKGTRLSIGGLIHDPTDPTDPTGKLFFGMLSLMAEFESDLIRARAREGGAEAKKAGRLKGNNRTSLSCNANTCSRTTTPVTTPPFNSARSAACPAPRGTRHCNEPGTSRSGPDRDAGIADPHTARRLDHPGQCLESRARSESVTPRGGTNS